MKGIAWAAACLLMFGVGACDDDEPAIVAGPAGCVPGEAIACAGPGGCRGGQICEDDGTRYGACDCTLSLPDAASRPPEAGDPDGRGFPDASADARDASAVDGTAAPDVVDDAGGQGPFGCAGGGLVRCGDGVRDPGEICYQPPTRIALASDAESVYQDIARGDLDADGRDEILVLLRETVGTTRLHVLTTDAEGTTEAAAPIDICDECEVRLAVGDVDGDGRLDVVALAAFVTQLGVVSSIAVHYLEGDGTGQLAAPESWQVLLQSLPSGLLPQFSIELADADGDGSDELFFSLFGNDGFIFPSDGSGGFTLTPPYARFGVDGWPHIADLTNDGRPEIVGGTTALSIALNDGSGGFDFASSYIGVFGPNTRVADMDNDGVMDLVGPSVVQARIVYGNGFGGVIGPGRLIDTAAPVEAVFPADVTNDGCMDIIAVHAGVFSVLPATGGGAFGTFRTYPGLRGIVEAADLNGDGLIDLASADAANHTLDVVLSNP